MNRFLSSPVPQGDGTRARMVNAVMTGDLADNMQRNETEWVVQLLEGGTLDPNSGTGRPDRDAPARRARRSTTRRTTPGVQDYDDYFESAAFYDPDKPIGQYANWPAYPGLMDRAQAPFEAEGLKVPSYSLFGNHDGLVQGNEDAVRAVRGHRDRLREAVQPGDAPTSPRPSTRASSRRSRGTSFLVPPDANRQFVDKAQFKALHATGTPGRRARLRARAAGGARGVARRGRVLLVEPLPNVRFIVLDTLSEGGMVAASSDGNIDDPQWKWLEKELDAATERNELIVVFGHHATGSLTADVADEEASDCTERDEHGHDTNPGCDRDPRSSEPLHLGDELKELFLAHPHVVAFVAGHSHNNRVAAVQGRERLRLLGDQEPGDLRLAAAAAADRADGELRRDALDLRDDARPRRARWTRPPAGPAGGFSPAELASIGRVLTYNDPQGDNVGQPRASRPTATSSSCSTTRARRARAIRSCGCA